MPMDDNSMVSIMQSLGLNFNPAERSIKSFEARIASLNKQLFEMKANAIAGARDINQAFSSQLGSMGSGKVILDQFGQPLKAAQTEAAKASTSMGNVSASYLKSSKAAKEHGQTVQEVTKKYNILGSELQRRVSWFTTGGLFYGGINAAKEAVQSISEVEMGVTQIARVMEDSSFVFRGYRNELLQMGVDYGQSFENVQDIALRWAQSGYNVKDSLDLTKTALLALNTAELDASNATASMVGIMSQWQMTAADLPLVLDKINKTADDFTVTSQDLVDGLLRSSGAAKIMGLSIDQTISLLTVMREASGRTGREVGNALNSILSYVQRPISIKTFEGLGIQVFADKARTQFRDVMYIFKDVAAKWQDLAPAIQDGFVKAADDAGLYSEELAAAIGNQQEWNDLQQRDLSQAAAGVYRRNYFIGMIERLSGAQKVLNGMTDAAGYSQTENARTMDTLEKKYESLKTAAQELAVALGDAGLLDILKGLTDTATSAADGFTKLDSDTRSLIITALELFGALKGIKAVGSLFGAEATLGTAIKVLPGWTKLIPIVLTAASAIGLYAFNSKAAAGTMSDQEKALAQLSEQYFALKAKMADIDKETNDYNDAQNNMLGLMNQIAQNSPELITALDEHARITGIDETALRNLSDAYSKLEEAQNNHLSNLSTITDEQLRLDRERLNSTVDTLESQLKAEQAALDYFQNRAPAYVNKKKATNWMESVGNFFYQNGFLGTGLGATEGWGVTPEESTINDMSETLKALEEARGNKSAIDAEIDTNRPWLNLPEGMPESMRKQIEESMKAAQNKGVKVETIIPPVSNKPYKNPQLDAALRQLEHKKALNQVSLEDEIAYLKNVNLLYVKNGDERWDIEERLYNATKALQDKKLQNSTDWINRQKSLGNLSAQEEIAAWNRVLAKQKDNAEAVKSANMGIFNAYKDLLSEQQKDIKKAYDDRISLIDKEIDKQDEKKKKLERDEESRDYKNEMADLQKDLAYWSVRTSEEARQKVAELNAKITEKEHDREIELQKQTIDDKKDGLEKDKENWKAAYKDIEEAFNEHNVNVVALAATNSKAAYQEWVNNYLIPLQTALKTGNLKDVQTAADNLTGSDGEIRTTLHDYGMSDSDYKNFVANGNAWKSADAENKIKLQAKNDALRSQYGIPAGEYPKFHTGAETLSYGMATFKPGELVFPPTLSTDLKALISVLSGGGSRQLQNISTDNRKSVKIDKMINIEHYSPEDGTDITIFSRELKRELASMTG